MMRASLLAFVIACSAPAWKPPHSADEILVDGELVARQETDGTIAVTVTVTQDARSAAGTVRFRTGDLSSALKSPHVRVARARAWLAMGHLLATSPEAAYDAMKRGREALEGYTFGDDIGHYKADLAHKAGHADEAVKHMTNALRADLREYERRFHEQLW